LGNWWKFKYSKKIQLAGAGTQTAGLAFGGYTTALSAATEEYNGATWTTVGSLEYVQEN
jgi:hypothetical protein